MTARITAAQAKKLGIGHGGMSRKCKTSEHDASKRLIEAACRAHGLPAPIFEYHWHPTRKFRADMLFDDFLLVEKDGGLYGRGAPCPTCGQRAVGAHSSITQMKDDRERDREAIILGFLILRFTTEEFDDGSAFAFIKRVLEAREELA